MTRTGSIWRDATARPVTPAAGRLSYPRSAAGAASGCRSCARAPAGGPAARTRRGVAAFDLLDRNPWAAQWIITSSAGTGFAARIDWVSSTTAIGSSARPAFSLAWQRSRSWMAALVPSRTPLYRPCRDACLAPRRRLPQDKHRWTTLSSFVPMVSQSLATWRPATQPCRV